MKQLYINDQLVDLDEKEHPVACTYSVNSLADLQSRQGNTTNRFKIPMTENNRAIFGFPDDAAFTQMEPYRKLPAKLIQNGVEIVPFGYAVVLSASDVIDLQVISGLINFFDLIDGKQLKDIDFSDLEHEWTLANVVASQSNTEGYIWPVIDYGAIDEFESVVDVKQLRPAVFQLTIIDRIIKATGYRYEGDIFQDERVRKTIVPFTNDTFEHGTSFVNQINNLTSSARKTLDQGLPAEVRDHVITFQDAAATDPSGSWNGSEYTAQEIIKVKIGLKYGIQIRDQWKGGAPPSFVIKVQKFAAGVWTTVAENVHTAAEEFKDIDFFDQTLEGESDLNTGDKIRVLAHSEPAANRIRGSVYAGAQIKIEYVK